MMRNNPDPDKRITNSDEQEVAVNHSTRDEGGYDEPASMRQAEPSNSEKEKTGSEKEKTGISNPEKKRDPEKANSESERKIN